MANINGWTEHDNNKKPYYIYQNKHSYRGDFETQEEVAERKAQTRWRMKYVDRRLQEEYVAEHQKGYCPHCHVLLASNGICNMCGELINP